MIFTLPCGRCSWGRARICSLEWIRGRSATNASEVWRASVPRTCSCGVLESYQRAGVAILRNLRNNTTPSSLQRELKALVASGILQQRRDGISRPSRVVGSQASDDTDVALLRRDGV